MEYAQQFAAVMLVLGALGALLWLAKRRGWAALGVRGGGQRRLQPIERLALGPHHSLHLVRVGEEMLVVACSPGSCAVVDRLAARSAEGEVRR